MTSILFERLRQKYRTIAYPGGPAPELPDRWLGEPELEEGGGRGDVSYCPTGALSVGRLDMGRCLFCGACAERGDARFSRRFAMARFNREDLAVGGSGAAAAPAGGGERLTLIRNLFSKSFRLRQVSAGGCNACEADCNVLSTPAWDIGRFGISFVASPRHADGILVTGPVTDNMRLAVEKTYRATPSPKVVVAVGACAVSGGLYGDGSGKGVLDGMFPVDLYVPGCPPHPLTILEGLLRLLGRAGEGSE